MARLFRVFAPVPRPDRPHRSAPARSRFSFPRAALRRPPSPILALLLAFTVVCLGGCAGADAGRGAADEAAGLLATVRVVPERVTVLGYDRARFGGWAKVGACTAREAVLAEWFGNGAPAP